MSRRVSLGHGVLVEREAVELWLTLESRGCKLTVVRGGILISAPEGLGDEEQAELLRHGDDIRELTEYGACLRAGGLN